MKDFILNTVRLVDGQVIVTSTEDEMRRAVYALNNIAMKYNLKISVNKIKTTAMKGKMEVRIILVINIT
jgi:hypothetical protein